MRIRTVLSVVAAAGILTLATPAQAQEKGATNFGISYSNLTTFANNAHVTYPAGWLASIGSGVNEHASIVGEVGGSYKKIAGNYVKLHTYQVGVRFLSTKNEKATPFFQILTGGSRAGNSNGWILTPGGGVDTNLSDRVAVRVQGDWMLMRAGGSTTNGLRVGGGLVLKLNRQ